MGKLGQMGGLMWRVREKWVTGGWPKEIQQGRVSARDEVKVPVGWAGWAILTGSSQTCQHGSRSRSICHCLMVSITILMRDLVLSITSALDCHHWSPSCGCEDTSSADFYITFTSGATAEFKQEQSGSSHSYKGHFNINSFIVTSVSSFPHYET